MACNDAVAVSRRHVPKTIKRPVVLTSERPKRIIISGVGSLVASSSVLIGTLRFRSGGFTF